ncbi:MAG: BamA/TamA family outer membrane protein, partial [Deltaproteobacteria bacterium]|nr:BamA/TamA family outer membrane protein [Deltaproteobacteria bacterium]
ILPVDDLSRGTVFTALRMDTLDNARFPTRGSLGVLRFDFDLEALGSDEDAVSIVFDFTQALSWGRTTFLLNAELAKTFDNVDTIDRFFFLGGFLRLSGLHPDELVGTESALVTLRIQRQLANPGFAQFRFPLYVGISGEGGNAWLAPDDPRVKTTRYGGSVYFALDTPIAPFYIAYGFTNPDRHAAYLFLGQTF